MSAGGLRGVCGGGGAFGGGFGVDCGYIDFEYYHFGENIVKVQNMRSSIDKEYVNDWCTNSADRGETSAG